MLIRSFSFTASWTTKCAELVSICLLAVASIVQLEDLLCITLRYFLSCLLIRDQQSLVIGAEAPNVGLGIQRALDVHGGDTEIDIAKAAS